MFGTIDALRGQAPAIVATVEGPALAWRRQEIPLQLPRQRPSRADKCVEVCALPHWPLLVDPRTILHRLPCPVRTDKSHGGITQLQADVRQDLSATETPVTIRKHFE